MPISTSRRAITAALLALVSVPAVQAEEDPIIVTATRTAEIADETLSPVIIIDGETLKNQPGAEITDILHRYPGIDISRNGGPGQTPSIFIRGAESDHTLVMLNGVTINPGTIGNAAIQNIPLEMIEKIEIVKGPRSTLYGSDAIGGVINIITRKQHKEGSHYEATIGGGSYGTASAGFSARHNSGDRAAGITVNARQSDGFPTQTSQTVDRGFDNLSVNLYGQKQLGGTKATIEHWQAEGTTEYYDAYSTPTNVDQDFSNTTTSLKLENNPLENWVSKLKFAYMNDNIEQNQDNDFTRTQRRSLDWQNDIQVGKAQLFTAGLYFSDENTDSLSSGTEFHADTDVSALFIQDQVALDKHQLVAGARYTDHETYEDHTTWNLEYGFQATSRLKLTAAVSTAFRSPSATDLYGYGGNTDLKPEESTNKEVGIRYVIQKHSVQLNAFDNQIDNLVDYYDPDGYSGPTPGTNQNIDKVRIKGVEASYEYKAKHWLLSISAIDQNPRDLSDGSLLLKRPEQKYNISVAQFGSKHRLQLDATYVGDRKAYGGATMEAYTLVGLSGNYQLTESLTVTGRVENLTDEDYEVADGYNTPERSYYMDLRYIF